MRSSHGTIFDSGYAYAPLLRAIENADHHQTSWYRIAMQLITPHIDVSLLFNCAFIEYDE
jgi:hypothetical protein